MTIMFCLPRFLCIILRLGSSIPSRASAHLGRHLTNERTRAERSPFGFRRDPVGPRLHGVTSFVD